MASDVIDVSTERLAAYVVAKACTATLNQEIAQGRPRRPSVSARAAPEGKPMCPFERRDMPYIIGFTIVVVILILAFAHWF
jgi:hypothetical protein